MTLAVDVLTPSRDRLRMQVTLAPRFVAQRPEAAGLLAVEIEPGRILNAQHYPVLSHERLRALQLRGKNASHDTSSLPRKR